MVLYIQKPDSVTNLSLAPRPFYSQHFMILHQQNLHVTSLFFRCPHHFYFLKWNLTLSWVISTSRAISIVGVFLLHHVYQCPESWVGVFFDIHCGFRMFVSPCSWKSPWMVENTPWSCITHCLSLLQSFTLSRACSWTSTLSILLLTYRSSFYTSMTFTIGVLPTSALDTGCILPITI